MLKIRWEPKKIGTGITEREGIEIELLGIADSVSISDDLELPGEDAIEAAAAHCKTVIENGPWQAKAKSSEGLSPDKDSEEWFALKVLTNLGVAKHHSKIGDHDSAHRLTWQAGVLFTTGKMKFKWEPLALRGKKFLEDGPKGPRLDDLGKAIIEVLDDIGWKARASAVWDELLVRADSGKPPYDCIIPDDVEPNVLAWKRRSTGNEATLTRESFEKRLRRLKKKNLTTID